MMILQRQHTDFIPIKALPWGRYDTVLFDTLELAKAAAWSDDDYVVEIETFGITRYGRVRKIK